VKKLKMPIFFIVVCTIFILTGCVNIPSSQTAEIQTSKPIKSIISESEAEAFLKTKYEHNFHLSNNVIVITRLPDMDRQEEGELYYAFSVDYSDLETGFPDNIYYYEWVNSITKEVKIEEPELYSNIPDNIFPVPKNEGKEVRYEHFSPPLGDWDISTTYVFSDINVVEQYKELLRTVGFVDEGKVMVEDIVKVESLWRYNKGNGVTLFVELSSGLDEGMPAISMYINSVSSVPAIEPVISDAKAEISLKEIFGDLSTIYRLQDIDRQEKGILLYAFSVDYSVIGGISHPLPMGTFVYVWVDSISGEMNFEEPNLYANIPDNMFPIPKKNGEIISYDSFSPPHYGDISITYNFEDMSIIQLYKTQLKNAGFIDCGSVVSDDIVIVESYWNYYRSDDEITLIVEINTDEENKWFNITMCVNFLNG